MATSPIQKTMISYVTVQNKNAITVPANGELSVKVSDITRTVPEGYSVVGIRSYSTGANSIVIRNIIPQASEANDTFVVLRNITSSAQNLPANGFTIIVVYLKPV